MGFQLSIVLHIFGFTMLIGGMLIGLRAARMPNPSAELLKSVRFGYIVAGATLVLLSGLYQMLSLGFAHYFSQGWFHGKFTSAVLLLALAAFSFNKFQQVEKTGQPLSRKFTSLMHSAIGALFLAAIFLVIMGRSGQL